MPSLLARRCLRSGLKRWRGMNSVRTGPSLGVVFCMKSLNVLLIGLPFNPSLPLPDHPHRHPPTSAPAMGPRTSKSAGPDRPEPDGTAERPENAPSAQPCADLQAYRVWVG